MADIFAEIIYALGIYVGDISETLLCMVEDWLVSNTDLILMIHGDALFRWGSEIIDRVVEAGRYKYWISFTLHHHNVREFELRALKLLKVESKCFWKIMLYRWDLCNIRLCFPVL